MLVHVEVVRNIRNAVEEDNTLAVRNIKRSGLLQGRIFFGYGQSISLVFAVMLVSNRSAITSCTVSILSAI